MSPLITDTLYVHWIKCFTTGNIYRRIIRTVYILIYNNFLFVYSHFSYTQYAYLLNVHFNGYACFRKKAFYVFTSSSWNSIQRISIFRFSACCCKMKWPQSFTWHRSYRLLCIIDRIVHVHRIGSIPGGAKPQVGGWVGQVEVEVGQRDVADQSDVPGGVGRGEKVAGRSGEREGASGGPSGVTRGTARREHSEVTR